MKRSMLMLALLSAACTPTPPPPVPAQASQWVDPPAAVGTPRILALGDSYTIGETEAVDARWPLQLVAALNSKGHAFAQPTIIARTGWSTEQLTTAVAESGLQGPYDLVTLLVGVNNQYRGAKADAYREPFKKLLARAIELAGGRTHPVIVVSIPDWGATPFAGKQDRAAIGQAIDTFNDVNRDEAEKAKVPYVEITLASRRALTEPALTAKDGLHPSRTMYAEWVEKVLLVAIEALGKR